MLEGWLKTGKPKLCFPWIKFRVHTLPASPFWMYFYYAQKLTDVPSLMGKVEFRVRVTAWQPALNYAGNDIHLVREHENGTAWFLCDRFEEIAKENGQLLSLSDFNHAQGKNLVSSMRKSIPQVILGTKVRIVRCLSLINNQDSRKLR